jgi:hypothetical protein
VLRAEGVTRALEVGCVVQLDDAVALLVRLAQVQVHAVLAEH